MPSDKQRYYEVGYGKPPCQSRFKKGQSGNPRGRAPGAQNLKTVLIDALNELVVVAENGGRRKISKRQAIIKQLVNQAAKGDWPAAKLLFQIVQDLEPPTEPETSQDSFGAADEKVIEQLKARLRGKKPGSDD
jgi:predicted Rdx family selenoprotein